MSLYNLSYRDSHGVEHSMSEHRGKVLLIVNTATKCGLASQFTGLEKLHQEYADKGLVVIGFPCARFLNQEPETNETMARICMRNFGVTFILTEKTDVNGAKTHPVFKQLKKALRAGIFGSRIKWNFTKFLVDRKGVPYKRYSPVTLPENMETDIANLLKVRA